MLQVSHLVRPTNQNKKEQGPSACWEGGSGQVGWTPVSAVTGAWELEHLLMGSLACALL